MTDGQQKKMSLFLCFSYSTECNIVDKQVVEAVL
jgi:hypothetical protein